MTDADLIAAQRALIAPLLTTAPQDAVAHYFALEHDAARTRLTLVYRAPGFPSAFVAVCQTGMDLFRPMVVFRGEEEAVVEALRRALQRPRAYLFSALPEQRAALRRVAQVSSDQPNAIYALDADDFRPVVNVLVQTSRTPDGLFRASIRSRDGSLVAEAGVSWMSSRYAEVFVRVAEAFRGRGLGKSVVSAVSAHVLEAGRTPLYLTSPNNLASVRLAERLGYHDTSQSEWSGVCTVL